MDTVFDYVGFKDDKMDIYEILTSLAWQGRVSFSQIHFASWLNEYRLNYLGMECCMNILSAFWFMINSWRTIATTDQLEANNGLSNSWLDLEKRVNTVVNKLE